MTATLSQNTWISQWRKQKIIISTLCVWSLKFFCPHLNLRNICQFILLLLLRPRFIWHLNSKFMLKWRGRLRRPHCTAAAEFNRVIKILNLIRGFISSWRDPWILLEYRSNYWIYNNISVFTLFPTCFCCGLFLSLLLNIPFISLLELQFN